MRVGILGSGLMGGKLGTLFARAGHQVVFSYSRSSKKLEKIAREAGTNARAGTPQEAARDADALLLAVHWSRVDDVLGRAGDVSGKVVVSCSLRMNADDTDLVVGRTSSGAEELARKVPGARIVSAFSALRRKRHRHQPCPAAARRGSRAASTRSSVLHPHGATPPGPFFLHQSCAAARRNSRAATTKSSVCTRVVRLASSADASLLNPACARTISASATAARSVARVMASRTAW